MKISYRTHPILEKLHNKDIGNFGYYSCDKAFIQANEGRIRNDFKKIAVGINHQIYNLSQSFIDAYDKGADKLFESNLFSEIEDDNICLIFPCWDIKSQKESVLLRIRNNKANKSIACEIFDFRDTTLASFGTFIFDYKTDNGKPEVYQVAWVSANIGKMYGHILNCLLITLFIKYAEVETRHLKPGQRDVGVECKYVNDTKVPINLLDSKWFTTLVKSDAFKVRGHFRLQPCGEGMKDRKFIWINDFVKDGYTAPARKLSHS